MLVTLGKGCCCQIRYVLSVNSHAACIKTIKTVLVVGFPVPLQLRFQVGCLKLQFYWSLVSTNGPKTSIINFEKSGVDMKLLPVPACQVTDSHWKHIFIENWNTVKEKYTPMQCYIRIFLGIIVEYNRTKGGVDCVDQQVAEFNSVRPAKRWPLKVWWIFFMSSIWCTNASMLDACPRFFEDIATFNSFIFWKAQNPNSSLRRDRYLTNLAVQLVTPNVMRRAQAPAINRITRTAMKDFFEGSGIPNSLILDPLCSVPLPPQPNEALPSHGRCVLCLRRKRAVAYVVMPANNSCSQSTPLKRVLAWTVLMCTEISSTNFFPLATLLWFP